MKLIRTKLGNRIFYYKKGDVVVGERIALKKYEEFETYLIKNITIKNGVAIDVGANIGYYSVILAKLVSRVFSFEPETDSFKVLKKNIELNFLKNVVLANKAVSNKKESLVLTVSKKNLGDHHLLKSGLNGRGVKVESVDLDSVIAQKVALLKVDTQGWEPNVIEGAKKIISKYKPTIFIEFWPKGYKRAGLEFNKMLDFLIGTYRTIHFIDDYLGLVYPVNKKELLKKCKQDKGYADLLFVDKLTLSDRLLFLKKFRFKNFVKAKLKFKGYVSQAIIDIFKAVAKGKLKIGELFNFFIYWVSPFVNHAHSNKFFDIRDFGYFKKIILKLGKNDPKWFPRLIEPSSRGLRGWEYSMLFDKIKFKNKKVLDVGSGNSRLPLYLAKIGANVTMLDMENPLEETIKKSGGKLKFVTGDMTQMTFENSKFDTVICISAIEHVDMKKAGYYVEKEYINRAILAIKEMARVLKSNGDFYMTTEFYLKKQHTDKWEYSDKKIRGAFKFKYLKVFLHELNKAGIKLDSLPEASSKVLDLDPRRANFRGRYFSTFAFRGKKI